MEIEYGSSVLITLRVMKVFTRSVKSTLALAVFVGWFAELIQRTTQAFTAGSHVADFGRLRLLDVQGGRTLLQGHGQLRIEIFIGFAVADVGHGVRKAHQHGSFDAFANPFEEST